MVVELSLALLLFLLAMILSYWAGWVARGRRHGCLRWMFEVKPKEVVMQEVSLPFTHKAVGVLAPTAEGGIPVKVDEDGELAVQVLSGDGTFVVLDDYNLELHPATGFVGDVTYLIKVDAKIGAGEEYLEETVVLHVTSPQATSMGLSFNVVPK